MKPKLVLIIFTIAALVALVTAPSAFAALVNKGPEAGQIVEYGKTAPVAEAEKPAQPEKVEKSTTFFSHKGPDAGRFVTVVFKDPPADVHCAGVKEPKSEGCLKCCNER